MDFTYTIWIPLVLFISFLITGLGGHKIKPLLSGLIAVAAAGIAWVLSLMTAWSYFFDVGKVDGVYQTLVPVNEVWINFNDSLHIDMGVLLKRELSQ